VFKAFLKNLKQKYEAWVAIKKVQKLVYFISSWLPLFHTLVLSTLKVLTSYIATPFLETEGTQGCDKAMI